MTEQGSVPPGQEAKHGKDWQSLVLLLVLVLPLRAWLLYNTEVAARDSIGFIRYALQLEERPWKQVLLFNHQHPGYPLAIWVCSQPMRALFGTDPITMRVTAQLVSALAALALLVPMYYLGKELFDRRVGFWGALLFQYFPVSGHHLSDGISEALFLLLVAMSLWRGVLAVRYYQAREFAWCGVFGGLAYLTRPEGALVVLATGLVLVAMQLQARQRKPWRSFFAAGVSLSAAAAAVGSVYVLTTGHLTGKPAAVSIGKMQFVSSAVAPAAAREVRGPLVASMVAVFIPRSDEFQTRLGRGLGAMAMEFSQDFHYVGWFPLLLALFWGWPRFASDARFWVLGGYCLVHGIILLMLAMLAFYVSDRHMLILVLCGTFFSVAGVREGARRLAAWYAQGRGISWLTMGRLSGLLFVAMALVCVPKTSQRLHGNRLGNRAAGEWLARHLAPGDVVDDDHAYSHYYAGLVFEESKTPVLPKGAQPTCYVVMTRSRDLDNVERKKREVELCTQARAVYHWPESRGWADARVVVYAQPRDRLKYPWTEAP